MTERVPVFEDTAEFARLSDVLNERLMQCTRPQLMSIDGRSGTGKTSLAHAIVRKHGGVVLHGDDFCDGGSFEEWTARTPLQRYQLSKNWERLRHDVLVPLLAGRTAMWRSYDWEADALSTEDTITYPRPFVVLEGVFSARPELKDIVDVSVLVEVPYPERVRRIALREGQAYMHSWFPIWEETENLYFETISPSSSFDTVYNNVHSVTIGDGR